MELFDKKFVHFMWDDELKGKKVFTADDMETLIKAVNNNHSRREVSHTISNLNTAEYDLRTPFRNADTLTVHQFVYYDPNYEVKKAYYKEGKELQYLLDDCWLDCKGEPNWESGYTFRVKPEVAWCVCETTGHGLQIVKLNDETECAALFKGTSEECIKWMMKRPCEDGIDSKACVGCEHSEDGKKEYRPYESSAEMIVDFIDRFKVNCPSFCEPLVWVKSKVTDPHCLIGTFCNDTVKFYDGTSVNFESLLKWYTYLDGSPIGMEVKE